jgi:hypothetical protein
MSLSIEYRLLKSGWAECTVRVGSTSQELTASYLSDALGNLILAAAAMLAGMHAVAMSFDEEPGEYRWVIERANGTDVSLQVLEFGELWGNKPNSEGELLIQTTCHPLVFGEAVHKAASAVLAAHGAAGYKERWVEHDFPFKQLELLASYIASWQHER